MKINVDTVCDDREDRHIFDWLYAYRQSQNNITYESDWKITFNSQTSDSDLNILFINVFKNWSNFDLDNYDLILLSNVLESLSVFNSQAIPLTIPDNSYIVANALLENDHTLYNKTLWAPYGAMIGCRDWWTRAFYPQLYENIKLSDSSRENKLIAINGINRANRAYFFDLLKKSNLSIDIVSNINSTVNKLRDACWETHEDTEFRDFVNARYDNNFFSNNTTQDIYYSKSVQIGIDKKFGTIAPGYFIMPEYFKYACVIFPESSWQNGELTITEKSCKCFYAGSVPFPIGGSGINKLYNTLGFSTAWNLLPTELQKFDCEKNHIQRYHGAIDAINWLQNNTDVFLSDSCQKLIQTNKETLLTGQPMLQSIKMLNLIIENALK